MESEHIFLLWKCFNFIFQLFSLKQTLVLKYTCSIMIISAMMCSTVASCGFPILGNNDIYYRDYTWITILKHTLLRVAFGLIVQGKRLEFNILYFIFNLNVWQKQFFKVSKGIAIREKGNVSLLLWLSARLYYVSSI